MPRRSESLVAGRQNILTAMAVTVLPITREIATQAQDPLFTHGDPADRLIGATALVHDLPLVTADEHLRNIQQLRCVW